jgi:uncharacterized protein (DUF3084 family)
MTEERDPRTRDLAAAEREAEALTQERDNLALEVERLTRMYQRASAERDSWVATANTLHRAVDQVQHFVRRIALTNEYGARAWVIAELRSALAVANLDPALGVVVTLPKSDGREIRQALVDYARGRGEKP